MYGFTCGCAGFVGFGAGFPGFAGVAPVPFPVTFPSEFPAGAGFPFIGVIGAMLVPAFEGAGKGVVKGAVKGAAGSSLAPCALCPAVPLLITTGAVPM
jgi:hypothetical protein